MESSELGVRLTNILRFIREGMMNIALWIVGGIVLLIGTSAAIHILQLENGIRKDVEEYRRRKGK